MGDRLGPIGRTDEKIQQKGNYCHTYCLRNRETNYEKEPNGRLKFPKISNFVLQIPIMFRNFERACYYHNGLTIALKQIQEKRSDTPYIHIYEQIDSR